MTITTKTLLYFVNGRSIYSISYNVGATNPPVNFRTVADDEITGFTQQWWQYRVYTKSGKMYMRDWFSKLLDVAYSTGTQTRYVHNHQTTDYIVSWEWPWSSVMYLSSGAMPQYLKRANKSKLMWAIKFSYDNLVSYGSNSTMAVYNNIFYSASRNPETNQRRIESYGAEYPGYPQSFNILTAVNSTGNVMTEIWPVFCPVGAYSKLYFCSRSAWPTRKIDYIPLDNTWSYQYMSSWTLFTKRYDDMFVRRRNISYPYKQKEVTDLQIRCDVPTGTQIVISYTVNWSWTYTPRTTINPVAWWDRDAFRRRRYKIDVSVRYYDIAFKIDLITTDPNTTPKLYSLFFWEEEVKS
jgi:hypothetical protein